MGGELNIQFGLDVNWATLKGCDALFLQRPALAPHVRMVDMAKANGKPVWIDYDDWLFSVPHSNKASRLYNNPTVQNNMSSLIAKADVISVSTEHLAGLIRVILDRLKRGAQSEPGLILDPDKVFVVPNAYDQDLMTELTLSKEPQKKMVSWRGSGTHDKDLLGVTPEIGRCVKNHMDWTYSFIGEPFWLTMELLDQAAGEGNRNVLAIETLDPIEYLSFILKTKPALMIVPLDDCDFNRSKSNIAWLESTHAGAVTLAPNFEEWRRPGIINYKDAKDFELKLESFLRGEIDGEHHWKLSRDFILKNITLQKVNEIRKNILLKLVER